QHADESILLPVQSGLECACGRKIGRGGGPGHIGVTRGIDCDCPAPVVVAAAQVGGINKRARRTEFGYTGASMLNPGVAIIETGRTGSLECSGCRGEVSRRSASRHINIARSVNGDAGTPSGVTATQVGGE